MAYNFNKHIDVNTFKKNIGLLLFLFAFLLRLVFAYYFYAKNGSSEFMDDLEYLSFAEQIIEQGILLPNPSEIYGNGFLVGPGWPLVIAFLKTVFGSTFWPVFIFNCIIGSFSVVLLYKLGKKFYSENLGIVLGIWAMTYIQFIKFGPTLLKENFAQFLVISIIWYLFHRLNVKKLLIFDTLFIIYLGFAVHVDERYLSYIPFILMGIVFLGQGNWQSKVPRAIYLALFFCLLLTPWAIRNNMVLGRPVLVSLRTAKFTDPIFGYKKDTLSFLGGFKKLSPYNRSELWYYELLADSISKGYKVDGRKAKFAPQMEEAYANGIQFRTYTSSESFWVELSELFRPFRFKHGMVANGYRFERKWQTLNNFVMILYYGIFLIFLPSGLYWLYLNNRSFLTVVALTIIIHTLVHLVLAFVRIRYRFPIDGLLVLIGMIGIFSLFQQSKFFGSQQISTSYAD
jgi:hypothetical protein